MEAELHQKENDWQAKSDSLEETIRRAMQEIEQLQNNKAEMEEEWLAKQEEWTKKTTAMEEHIHCVSVSNIKLRNLASMSDKEKKKMEKEKEKAKKEAEKRLKKEMKEQKKREEKDNKEREKTEKKERKEKQKQEKKEKEENKKREREQKNQRGTQEGGQEGYKFWKNKSIFLFNIVVADFLLVACLPVKAYHFYNGERRSEDDSVCKAMLFMLFLNRGASIAFLITLSIDRYFNVVHLGRKNFVKVLKKSPHISVVIWLLLLPLTIPTMLRTFECCNSHGRNKSMMKENNVTDTFREVVFFSQIVIPFIILVYCTVCIVNRLRKKTVGEKTKLRRAVWVVMSVLVVFSICFLPCATARAVLLGVRLMENQNAEDIVVQIYDGLMVLSFTDCLLDPLVYCFCNSGFKDAYISTFCPKFLQRRLLTSRATGGIVTTTTSGARTIYLPMIYK